MAKAHFSGKTIDDVMRLVIKEIRGHGDQIYRTKGGRRGQQMAVNAVRHFSIMI